MLVIYYYVTNSLEDICYLMVFLGQESRSGLAGFWFRVPHDVAVTLLAGAKVLSAGLQDLLLSSLTQLLAAGFSSLPHEPLHRAAHDMASSRVSDPRGESPRWKL